MGYIIGMLKLKDIVRMPNGKVGDIQSLKEGNAIHPDGLALVRFYRTNRGAWFRINELQPISWLND
jgi:hypothetical protein